MINVSSSLFYHHILIEFRTWARVEWHWTNVNGEFPRWSQARCVCECDMLKRQYFDHVESSLVESEIIMLSLMFSDQRTMRVKLMCIVSSKEVTVEQWWWWWRKSEKIALYRVNRRLSQYGDERRAEWVRTWWRTFLSSPSPSLCYIECENSNRSCWIVLLIF